MTFPWIYTRFD